MQTSKILLVWDGKEIINFKGDNEFKKLFINFLFYFYSIYFSYL